MNSDVCIGTMVIVRLLLGYEVIKRLVVNRKAFLMGRESLRVYSNLRITKSNYTVT